MRTAIEGIVQAAHALRAVRLTNADEPGQPFAAYRADAVMPEDVVFTPVRRLGELLRERRLSPVALAETFLDRLERLGPRYNAVVTVTRDRALEQARRAEARDRGRPLPRAAARHPVRRQGPARHLGRHPDHVGRGAVQGPACSTSTPP